MTYQNPLLVARKLMQTLVKRPRRGFTLIELLVVVVIIGILASIALPSFVGAQDKARNASVQANINTVRLALEQYSTDNNGSYPAVGNFYVATPLGLSGNNYLPGNKLPRSPWCKATQVIVIPFPGVAVKASDLANGTPMTALPMTIAAGGGLIGEPPTLNTHYGAIEYDNDPASQTYTVTGTGKRNKDAVISAETTNNGN
jgi:type II secretion system protein G